MSFQGKAVGEVRRCLEDQTSPSQISENPHLGPWASAWDTLRFLCRMASYGKLATGEWVGVEWHGPGGRLLAICPLMGFPKLR